MKKVLLVSYDFPPARSSGIYRPVKFVKHLRSLGWEPIVLTAKQIFVEAIDHSFEKDIPPETEVVRATAIDLQRLSDKVHSWLFGGPDADSTQSSASSSSHDSSESGRIRKKKPAFKRFLLSPLQRFAETWLFVPDAKILWYPLALFAAIRIVRRSRPTVIFTTSSPPTAHLVGLTLRFLFRLPWIADFRDNWVAGYADSYRSKLRLKLDTWMLVLILKRADRVVTVCEGIASDLWTFCPQSDIGKYHTITNGYDEADFAILPPSETSSQLSRIVLLHMGTVYKDTYGGFFESLRSAAIANPKLQETLVVRFIGYADECREKVRMLGLDKIVTLEGFKSHPEAVQAMCSADGLLLFLGGDNNFNRMYPGKFFEYLRTGKMIFALGTNGEITKALRESGRAVAVRYDDERQIESCLLDLCGQLLEVPEMRIGCVNKEFVRQFEWRNLTIRFVQVLNSLVSTDS